MWSNPDFKDLSRDYKKCLNSWYNYNYKQNNKDQEVRIPKDVTPNVLLAGLFKDDEVDYRLGNYLASILEKFADKKILA